MNSRCTYEHSIAIEQIAHNSTQSQCIRHTHAQLHCTTEISLHTVGR